MNVPLVVSKLELAEIPEPQRAAGAPDPLGERITIHKDPEDGALMADDAEVITSSVVTIPLEPVELLEDWDTDCSVATADAKKSKFQFTLWHLGS